MGDFFIRDANVDDFNEIRNFLSYEDTKLIGPQRRHNICLENFFRHYATYRLLAFLKEESYADQIVGYAEFRNYPCLYALPGEHWMDFMKSHYCLTIPISVTNTLFMTYCTLINDYNPKLIKDLLIEVFFREDQLKYIFIIEPPDERLLPNYEKVKENFRIDYLMLQDISHIYYPRVFSINSCSNTQKLHVMIRTDLVPAMSFRKALPEDNDDVIEVIDVDRPDLREEFGDYFIAEELLRLGIQHNLLIVTETNNSTAGFVWLNDDVDVMLLLENYEVEMFANLLKYNPKELTQEVTVSVPTLEKKPASKLFVKEAILESFDRRSGFIEPDKMSAVAVYSVCSFRIISIEGNIETVNDRYFLRGEYFGTLHQLCNHLENNSYYSYYFNKKVDLRFNVNESNIDTLSPVDNNCNVFALQLFGMHVNYDVRRLVRLIMAAFAAYPDRDYCVFSLPLGTPMTKNLRRILSYFVHMSQRPCCRLTDEVYITHRSSIYGEISLHDVRDVDFEDIDRIMMFNAVHFYDDILTTRFSDGTRMGSSTGYTVGEAIIVRNIIDDFFRNPFSVYTIKTIRCGRSTEPADKNVLIGFIILRPFSYVHLLGPHYLVPKPQYSFMERGEIITLRLHPFYHHQFREIFRELKRLTYYFEFYYIQSLKNGTVSLPNDLLLYMQPVEPRPYKKISKAIPSYSPADGKRDKNDFYERVNYVTDNYAVYCNNLCNLQFCGSDRPLVIIGFSPICKAFLRSFIFNWNIPGVNIPNKCSCIPQLKVVVITEPGVIEAEYDKDLVCELCQENKVTCFINDCNWSDYVSDVTKRMDVRKYIHHTSGHIESIDRENHNIVFQGGECQIYYERLLLLCETSFGCPRSVGVSDAHPPNYIQINNRFDRIMAFHKINFLRDLLSTVSAISVVIYGAHLRTYEFVHFLLQHEIPACMIKLIMPYQKGVRVSELIFNQPNADDRIEIILQTMVSDLGVKVYPNLTFSYWNTYHNDSNIASAIFVNRYGQAKEIEVDLFVSFYETYISPEMVNVLRDANIKMNHRNVVVDNDFRTSDPSIYAFGNFIEHAEEPNHQYKFVSHKEAAEKLIYKLGLIPAQLEKPYLPKFSEPHSCEVVLPLGYRLFKGVIPKRYLANHLNNEYTHSLVTFSGTFTRVRLNPFGIVEEIVCVTQKKISFQFLLLFLGRHEVLLNNLRSRWCNDEIKCFLNYFQQPWTELILHEHFGDLLAENRKLLLPLALDHVNLNVERRQRKLHFKHMAQKTNILKELEQAFLKFIRTHIREIHQPLALPEDFPQPSK